MKGEKIIHFKETAEGKMTCFVITGYDSYLFSVTSIISRKNITFLFMCSFVKDVLYLISPLLWEHLDYFQFLFVRGNSAWLTLYVCHFRGVYLSRNSLRCEIAEVGITKMPWNFMAICISIISVSTFPYLTMNYLKYIHFISLISF